MTAVRWYVVMGSIAHISISFQTCDMCLEIYVSYSQGFRGSSRTQVLGHEEAQRLFCHIRTLQYYK